MAAIHLLEAFLPFKVAIQRLKNVIIGSAEGDGYGPGPQTGTWKDFFLAEIKGNYDPTKVHFIGSLNHPDYFHVLQNSWIYVYLTIPFVLSWSLLEAMSRGSALIGSSTALVQEVIKHQENGLLTNFFDPNILA